MSLQSDRLDEARELLDRIIPRIGELGYKETQFIESIADRIDRQGDRMTVSVGQIGWLRDIEQRL